MKTEKIRLGDGNEYEVGVLNVGDLIEIEDKFGETQINTAQIKNVNYWLWLSIRKCNKDMGLEKLYELIDAPFIASGGMDSIFKVISKLNGWDKASKNVESPVKEKQA